MRLFKVSIPEHIEYPRIDPVPEGVHRPFWSVMIPTYNRANYLERTLKSVLEQDPGPEEMQIEVVDDCSTKDDPEVVVKDIGKGRVSFFRQPQNVGISANFTTCVQRAKGYWVHILHSDDMVLPGFYSAYKHFITEHPEVVMVFCRAIAVDENNEWERILYGAPNKRCSGIIEDASYKLAKTNFIVAPTVVIHRDIYERVGGFAPWASHTADWEMWQRIAAYGPVGYIHHPYLLYRSHSESDTNKLMLSGENIRQIVKTIELFLQRIPDERRGDIRHTAYRNHSRYALSWCATLHAQGLHGSALRHAVWAFRLNPSMMNLLRLLKSYWRAVVR